MAYVEFFFLILQLGGPIWSAPIHDKNFVNEVISAVEASDLGTKKRLEGVLAVIVEELNDVPLYYSLDRLFSTVHSTSMSMMMFRYVFLFFFYRNQWFKLINY